MATKTREGITSGLLIIAAALFVALTLRDVLGPKPDLPESRPLRPTINLDSAPMKGQSDAPIAMIIFSDFECPVCGVFEAGAGEQFENEFVKTGLVVESFRHFPLQRIHPNALAAARIAICADRQSRFWPMHDQLFAHQLSLGPENLKVFAAAVGLDSTALATCLANPPDVSRDVEIGAALGVHATPTLVFGRRHEGQSIKAETMISGAPSIRQIRTVIARLGESPR